MIYPDNPYDQDIFGVRRVILGGDEPSLESEVDFLMGQRSLAVKKQQADAADASQEPADKPSDS